MYQKMSAFNDVNVMYKITQRLLIRINIFDRIYYRGSESGKIDTHTQDISRG